MGQEEIEIKIGKSYEIPPFLKERPSAVREIGKPNPNEDHIYISVSAHEMMRKYYDKECFTEGEFHEEGGLLIGHRCRDNLGLEWVEASDFVPMRNLGRKSGGQITFTIPAVEEAVAQREKLAQERNDPHLVTVGFTHAHPKGWGIALSPQDDKALVSQLMDWQINHVYSPEDRVESVFSRKGTDTKSDRPHERHKGFYIFKEPIKIQIIERTGPEPKVTILTPAVRRQKEVPIEIPFEEAVREIQKTLVSKKKWQDLEPVAGKKEEKTRFFNYLRAVFGGISQLEDLGRRKGLIHEPLSRAFAQYPATALILGKYLFGEERELIDLGYVATQVVICLSKKEHFSSMKSDQQEEVLATLTRAFGEYLWGIGLIKGKGSYEQRLEHAELLLENVLGTFPEIGQRVAEKIEEL